jgi:16S rRNA (adenine1518-N6/adenine1519-N6)-dimethyltransferase
MTKLHDIPLKKRHGQNFLCDANIVHCMLDAVVINSDTNMFEIGPGGGFLTRAILETPVARLWAFEIDPEWAQYLKRTIADARITVFEQDFLTTDLHILAPYKKWTILANLPYHLTFPILRMLQQHRHLLTEGVLMMQEEVAQKIVKKSGRDFGVSSLFYQRFFDWRLLEKIPPTAFNPPPKVFSRLLHFVPRDSVEPIEHEDQFWLFLKACFAYPRRTLVNNIRQSRYNNIVVPPPLQLLRAQQISMPQFIAWWHDEVCDMINKN